MAYDFTTNDRYLGTFPTTITNYPFTLACWVYIDNIGNIRTFMCLGPSASSLLLNRIGVNASTGTIYAQSDNGTNTGTATTASGVSLSRWYHVAGVFTSSTDRAIYVDGGNKVSETATTVTMTTPMARISIGARLRSNFFAHFMDGKMAEMAVWTAALNDNQINSLYLGVKPTSISPESLLFYAPFIRDVNDVSGGISLAVTGAPTVFQHPRRIG